MGEAIINVFLRLFCVFRIHLDDLYKMQTWCIYIDEAGVANVPDFVYAAICIPFNSQQEFSKSYSRIVRPLIPISGRERLVPVN